MANIREISGRIKSIQDTMKITNAMYMISSTKLLKARKSQEGNAPYFAALQNMALHILDSCPELENHYLDLRPEKTGRERTRAILVVTADKGLAGAYNHNVIKAALDLMDDEISSRLYVVGEAGRQYFAGKDVYIDGQFQYTAQNPTLYRARIIAEDLLGEFLTEEVDEIYMVYTGLKNGIMSEARSMRLLPLVKSDVDARNTASGELDYEGMTFYPSAGEVLDNIVPDILVGSIFSGLIESFCSEQNDRMMAMESANENARAMIHDLSISYNRVRQALITQEITEVIAGAKAQKKKKKAKTGGDES